MSVRQGELITNLLTELGRPWNNAFRGGPIAVEDDSLPAAELPGGLRITILAPRRDRLRKLASQWEREIARAGLAPEGPAEETESPVASSEAAQPGTAQPEESADDRDADVPEDELRALTIGDVEQMARQPFRPDSSVGNGSSIAILLELDGRTILVSGDAGAPDLEKSIRSLLATSSARRLRVDAFVVPHNGSRSNMSIELLELLECSNYLISTNGAYFGHPDPETIAKIITYGRPSAAEQLRIIFNYRSARNDIWSSPQLQAELNYQAIYPDSGDGAIRVDVSSTKLA